MLSCKISLPDADKFVARSRLQTSLVLLHEDIMKEEMTFGDYFSVEDVHIDLCCTLVEHPTQACLVLSKKSEVTKQCVWLDTSDRNPRCNKIVLLVLTSQGMS